MLKGILQSDLFFCNHIGVSENDEADIAAFTVRDEKGEGLREYIQNYAVSDENAGTMRTYIVRDNYSSELVGYFSLKAGLISLNEREEEIPDSETGSNTTVTMFDTVPGVELANFAVNDTYIRNHPALKGVGLVIFEQFILPLIARASEIIGTKVLYIFALPYDDLIARYMDYGFMRLDDPYEDELHKRLKPSYDQSCIFMYQIL